MQKIAKYLFWAGLVLAVIAGVVPIAWLMLILVLLGIVFGIFIMGGKDWQHFLVAVVALWATSEALSVIPFLGGYLTDILGAAFAFLAPAALAVLFRGLFDMF
jgi:hypothetical protein